MTSNKTLIFNKPYGVLSNFVDEEGRETLKHFIPIQGVYSAGRLDYDSEGLLVLTNDGDLIHRLTDPKNHVPKTYWVQVEGLPTAEQLTDLEKGVIIQGVRTRQCQAIQISEPILPARKKPITPHGPTSWIQMVIHEGKKRQIRHMTAAVGLPTLRLVRIAIGPISIQNLEPGQWRFLESSEVESLMLQPSRQKTLNK